MMLRCAVYTRKSTDEGLEQEFNSLDAQREACEAYIKSQKHEGWKLLPQYYDDGGYSGGSMERPALKKLLQEIEAGRVDIIVVYKVDRLTRALSDFARMVELFDTNKVSFVSVTQQFNTTTSMGRLTLNVLLSFAQFEREVTAERIRDKIAASKKKGMWMGGTIPIGYDTQDKRLIINAAEAETVRTLFDLYLKLGSVSRLKEESDRRNIRTKLRGGPDGKTTGGSPFTRGNLYDVLSNTTYVGDVRHKTAIYPGQHEPIVDRSTWQTAQDILKGNAPNRGAARNGQSPHLLTGLAFDENGDRLSPTHANKKGRRYHYYVSRRLIRQGRGNGSGWRLGAKQLDYAVARAIGGFLANEQRLIDTLKFPAATSDHVRAILKRARGLSIDLTNDQHEEHRGDLLRRLIHRITLRADTLCIQLKRSQLRAAIMSDDPSPKDTMEELIDLDVPVEMKRCGVEAKLILHSTSHDAIQPDDDLIDLVTRARSWFNQLVLGEVGSVLAIAQQYTKDPSDAGHDLQFAFLAPEIVEAILAGRHPANLTVKRLRKIASLPLSWHQQNKMLGFAGKSTTE